VDLLGRGIIARSSSVGSAPIPLPPAFSPVCRSRARSWRNEKSLETAALLTRFRLSTRLSTSQCIVSALTPRAYRASTSRVRVPSAEARPLWMPVLVHISVSRPDAASSVSPRSC